MGPDLKHSGWMYFKALCFGLIALICAAGLLLPAFEWRNLVLVCLLVWASARFYYFCFYVIERYIDPSFRFAGVLSVVGYVLRGGKSRGITDRSDPEDLGTRG